MANNNQKPAAQPATESVNISEAFLVKHKNAVLIAVIAVIIVVAGVVLYNTYYAAPRELKASTAIAKGQEYFNAGDFAKALNGDSASFAGFVAMASDYSGTKAGNLSNLYAGLCCAQLGKWQEAATYLEQFSPKDDQMISPAAQGALGNAYAHLNQLDKAVETLTNAARKADNNSLSPTFLIQAGEILESQGKNDEAVKLYQEVKDKYFRSLQWQQIDKYIERATVK